MKLTNREVFESRAPLQVLMDVKFPVKVSYALAKLVGRLNPHLKAIEEVRGALVRQYGKPGPMNQVLVQESDEGYPEFVEKFSELMAIEVELDYEPHIVLPLEAGGGPLEVTPAALVALERFITLEGAEDGKTQ